MIPSRRWHFSALTAGVEQQLKVFIERVQDGQTEWINDDGGAGEGCQRADVWDRLSPERHSEALQADVFNRHGEPILVQSHDQNGEKEWVLKSAQFNAVKHRSHCSRGCSIIVFVLLPFCTVFAPHDLLASNGIVGKLCCECMKNCKIPVTPTET